VRLDKTRMVCVLASFALVACGDSSPGGSGGTAGAGGSAGAGGTAGSGGGSAGTGGGGSGGSAEPCRAGVSDGVLTNLEDVFFFDSGSSDIAVQTANIFVVEREAQFTVFAYGEVQNTGSSVQCSFLMDLALGNQLLTAVVNTPTYQGQAPAGTRGCLAPGEAGGFQALRNGVSEDLAENLTRVDYAISELSFGAEVPSQATPTVSSSEILFDSDDEPYVAGEARSTSQSISFLNMDFYLRNSCDLVVAVVKARPNVPGTNADFSFESAAAVSQQGRDVEDYLLFQSFQND